MALVFDAKTNFAYSVVATPPAPAASGTSVVVAPGDGAKFPAAPFNAVIWPTGVQPTTTNAEIVRVTAKAVDTFTITRTQEGTVARTVVTNDQIALNITAKTLTDIEAAFALAGQTTCPVGSIVMWPTTSAPTGWLLLDGSAVSRVTYADLYALIGTTFGPGDGATTFNLPDMRSRLPIGKAAAGAISTIGTTTGSWDHTHGPGTLRVDNHVHGPGTLQVESHTHASGTLQVASHTHGAGTLTVASHSHDAGSYGTNSVNLAHTHDLGNHTHSGTTGAPGTTSNIMGAGSDAVVSADHTHAFTTGGPSTNTSGAMSANANHSHSVTGSSGSTGPAVNAGSTASTAPAVNSGATAGTSPFVTLGLTAAQNPFVTSGVSATANPPVLVINFIIRANSSV